MSKGGEAPFDGVAAEWTHLRGLTVDLLHACSDTDLKFALNSTTGSLWKQFRHIGRVHGVYLDAITSGAMTFSHSAGGYSGGASKSALATYFDDLAARHSNAFRFSEPETIIDWFDEQVPLSIHLVRLLSHETLHHGQLMLYWRALGHPFPSSWASWGAA